MKIRFWSLWIVLYLPLSLFAQEWRPLKKTCDIYGNETAEKFLLMSVSDFEKLDDQEGMAYLKKLFVGYEDYYRTFLVLASPSLPLAEKALRLNLLRLMELTCGDVPSNNSLPVILQALRPCLKNHFAGLKTKHTNAALHSDYYPTYPQHIQKAQVILTAVCDKLNIKQSHCRSDLIDFFKLVNPSHLSPYVTVPQEFFRISFEPRLSELARDLAFYYLDIFATGVRNGGPAGRDVFHDLMEFFQGKGMTPKEATEHAFYFLGVYGARGATFLTDDRFDFHPHALSAMTILSLGISYLDKLSHTKGKSYALPREFRKTCHTGKPYHFWMAAFLSRYAKKQLFSPAISYYGPVISGIAYDFVADYNGRDIKQLFKIKSIMDNYAVMTRTDNWVRAMGAHFGHHDGIIKPLDADALLDEMFKKSELPSKDPGEDMVERVKQYNRIVRPIPLILGLSK